MAFPAANGQLYLEQDHLSEASFQVDCSLGAAEWFSMLNEQSYTPGSEHRMFSGYYVQSYFAPYQVSQDTMSQLSSSMSPASQPNQQSTPSHYSTSHITTHSKQLSKAHLLDPIPADITKHADQHHITSHPFNPSSEANPSPDRISPKRSRSLPSASQAYPQLRPPPRAPTRHRHSTTSLARSAASSSSDAERTLAKKAHSAVERKYRQNLNSRIAELHAVLLATRRLERSSGGRSSGLVAVSSPGMMVAKEGTTKASKSEVLRNAVRYVEVMEALVRELEAEVLGLKGRLGAWEGAMRATASMRV
jgi:hypothetical protein